ncbi:MAG: hypothetical protein P8J27_07275 [Mariniblastus sp.]|nr:hypothetical protein [Mariniblastus sp.]
MERFDPYQQWLGIPTQMRPLNHYILLGIQLFENDVSLIDRAYDERMSLLKSFQSGPRFSLSEQLIVKVGSAKRELTDPEKKRVYDDQLRMRLQKIQKNLNSLNENETGNQSVDLGANSNVARESPAAFENNKPKGGNAIASAAIADAAIASPMNESQASYRSGELDEPDGDSIFDYLVDVRVWVAVITVAVVVMLVTVKLLSSSSEIAPATLDVKPDPPSATVQPATPSDLEPSEVVEPSYSNVRQNADASFQVPLQKATLKGEKLKYGGSGISGWGQADQALWTLTSPDRRNGYFQCRVVYRSKFECTFSVQLGKRPPRRFTIYPHDEDFEEEFIVRLDKSESQTLRLIAGELEFSPGVEIKQIRLMPTR